MNEEVFVKLKEILDQFNKRHNKTSLEVIKIYDALDTINTNIHLLTLKVENIKSEVLSNRRI